MNRRPPRPLIREDASEPLLSGMTSTASQRAVPVFGREPKRSVRLNVELDHAKRAKWSPDNRALVLCTALANRVHVYRVKRREDGSPGSAEPLLQFRDAHRSSELINVGIACNGNFIMSISMDTTLCVWSLKVLNDGRPPPDGDEHSLHRSPPSPTTLLRVVRCLCAYVHRSDEIRGRTEAYRHPAAAAARRLCKPGTTSGWFVFSLFTPSPPHLSFSADKVVCLAFFSLRAVREIESVASCVTLRMRP
ncbi:hypothetical protein HPB49_014743 [Dermacentor silvarum]|uniref:Uncharacterized protein n=1 Tax=Dermacentor silvarum TaxID=543639 RepID=A0ACB8D678_DERSI|nr:hypothetical protein HPB49_014743 [Dermacentor silvarum]